MDGYVDQCIDYIVKHYRDKIYLDELASALGLSGNYLSKLFAKETGVSFVSSCVAPGSWGLQR